MGEKPMKKCSTCNEVIRTALKFEPEQDDDLCNKCWLYISTFPPQEREKVKEVYAKKITTIFKPEELCKDCGFPKHKDKHYG
jgi:hypothetical protein